MSDTLPEIREFLEHIGQPFEVWDCDPNYADTVVFCEHYDISPDSSANTILVKSKRGEQKYALCVLLASSRLDVNNTVRKKLGVRKASFATADETRTITGMEIGGVTPFALPNDLVVWVDDNVVEREYIVLGGGNRTSKLKVSPKTFEHMHNIEIVSGLAVKS
ncbi:MAG: YbaK/EbsC family protein [bacterium]